MVPSPRLMILVMASAPLFLAGALYEGAAAVGVLYVIVLALYTSLDAVLLPRRRHIAVTRSIPERISVGYPTVMRYTVENRTRRRIQVQLAEDWPGGDRHFPDGVLGRRPGTGADRRARMPPHGAPAGHAPAGTPLRPSASGHRAAVPPVPTGPAGRDSGLSEPDERPQDRAAGAPGLQLRAGIGPAPAHRPGLRVREPPPLRPRRRDVADRMEGDRPAGRPDRQEFRAGTAAEHPRGPRRRPGHGG